MGISDALSIASSGLHSTEHALAVASQNVANASTTGYVKEVATQVAVSYGGIGGGVAVGATARDVNTALENLLYTKNADVSSYATLDNALSAISAVQGTTSSDSTTSTGTLSDVLGTLQSAFTTLSATPSDSTAQRTVVSDAQTVADTVNKLASAYQSERQTAQDSIVSTVSTINTDLTTIGSMSKQIMTLKAQGVDTADLENQRAAVMQDLSTQTSVSFSATANGDMLVRTSTGLALPTRPTTDGVTIPTSAWPLSTSAATLTSTSSVPAITLNGADVTSGLSGGTLGANIQLRDQTLPTMQAQLDSFSSALANRFDAQGLTLFSDSAGALPGSSSTQAPPDGVVGFSSMLSVNPAVTADPRLVVTGTRASSSTSSIIGNVLSYTFGTTLADGTAQPAAPSQGLGASGTLSTGYAGTLSLGSLATALTANQASVISGASSSLQVATAAQTSLQTKVGTVSGVDTDSEMSTIVTLQNAYAANAKVVAAVQSMFASLIAAV
ncbi:flagellar hook-associated protein FlgK [Ameyamaea chiangmaiensis NBRC 103196]|uniref:Flagellar hook-associated protein 1 n=1 Tax=Ameyamaea chiangmaiensis TaxID=442969 RepID=A0A850PC27_9PROT|nr:flagellar hook-associated protein FlgK [Ameyamaea chiangmaiensis]MBS4075038.1 flagellar hook-associated protein FlgK [Ameyamaea chiangmaiensis]NVN40080.1 flagellar hook-associated protein FlgK [Ameyamaea chiangmaiensis]GBQ65689.1 flagellar hook-associated protein FlgK [Ameyamaea chiangmaiensis NBRC 103196]